MKIRAEERKGERLNAGVWKEENVFSQIGLR